MKNWPTTVVYIRIGNHIFISYTLCNPCNWIGYLHLMMSSIKAEEKKRRREEERLIWGKLLYT